MAGVGQQRQGIRQQAKNSLNDNESDIQNYAGSERPVVIRSCVVVMMVDLSVQKISRLENIASFIVSVQSILL